jgi:hypothetical protein
MQGCGNYGIAKELPAGQFQQKYQTSKPVLFCRNTSTVSIEVKGTGVVNEYYSR